MMINKQVWECLHQLNVLHDIIAMEYADRWDLTWHLDQIENARICLYKVMEKDGDSDGKND